MGFGIKTHFFFYIFNILESNLGRKMNQEQKTFKNNRKLHVFLLFLILAFVFWMLIKLSRTYTSTVNVDLNYTDLPKNKMLQSEPETVVKVTLRAVGFTLLKHKFTNRKVEVSLKNSKRKRRDEYYLLSSTVLGSVNNSFAKSEVIGIEPDTLLFELGKSISKKVKVEPDVTIQYKSGYNLSGDLEVDPPYITISGPKSLVDSVIYVSTKSLKIEDVQDTIHREIEIISNAKTSKLTYSTELVTIKGKVEKFTERTIEVPIKVKNVPNAYTIKTFPDKVKVVFQVGLSDFNRIDENDFEVVCDFSIIESDGIDYLIPKVVNKPSFVTGVKIVPNEVEFLLEK